MLVAKLKPLTNPILPNQTQEACQAKLGQPKPAQVKPVQAKEGKPPLPLRQEDHPPRLSPEQLPPSSPSHGHSWKLPRARLTSRVLPQPKELKSTGAQVKNGQCLVIQFYFKVGHLFKGKRGKSLVKVIFLMRVLRPRILHYPQDERCREGANLLLLSSFLILWSKWILKIRN